MKAILTLCLLYVLGPCLAQRSLVFTILDSATRQPVAGATVQNATIGKSHSASTDGIVKFMLPEARYSFQITAVGYHPSIIELHLSTDTAVSIRLSKVEQQMEEVVVVSSSRTNSRLEDLPTRVEVLGSEEVQEENGIKPANITGLLGDVAGIQIQQTSATSGNADIRIQGVPGKYTQLLRDGMPLFGGYSGSFTLLQIPPLDLQQIEVIKGAASTLYGGGAIAGLVNLISKKPRLGKPERMVTFNHSTLNENNLNAFASARSHKVGYTFFTGATLQQVKDVNKDGFSDVAGVKSFFVQPRLFLYTSTKSNFSLGYLFNYEDRKGGDMERLQHAADLQHQFFVDNISLRNTADFSWETKFDANSSFTLKNSTSLFGRSISTNVFGMKANQLSWYSEATYTHKWASLNFAGGLNWNGERFRKREPDSSKLNNYGNYSLGAFAQVDWSFLPKLTVQSGLRIDYVHYASQEKILPLPHLSFMYRLSPQITGRIGGGLGYKIPTPFSAEIDEREYKNLQFDADKLTQEHSYSTNADINYKIKIGGWNATFNQGLFYLRIRHPLVVSETVGALAFFNAEAPIVTQGTETYIQLHKDEVNIYLGYNYTDARRSYTPYNHLPLTAKHKAAATMDYELSEKWTTRLEAAYTGRQYLESGASTPSYLFTAAMVKYSISKVAVVLNCENLLDYRQSKKQAVVYPPYTNPVFAEVWAPLEGRIINLSVMVKW